jgi:hypothetical protein
MNSPIDSSEELNDIRTLICELSPAERVIVYKTANEIKKMAIKLGKGLDIAALTLALGEIMSEYE